MNFITRYLMYPNQRAMFKQVRIINPVNIKISNSLIKKTPLNSKNNQVDINTLINMSSA